MKVLITGGAGFIGSHLTDRLIAAGAKVRILDSLEPQVHEGDRQPPAYLNPGADLFVGDVCDKQAVLEALDAVDAVFHFAARVGVAQSMYQIAAYTAANTVGTAVLLEALVDRPIRRLIVASSMSIYGEGRCRVPTAGRTGRGRRNGGRVVDPPDRRPEDLAQAPPARWDPALPDGTPLIPIPTPEDKPPTLASVYAISKYDQERLCMIFGATYRVPTVALRFFNVYGARQALSNPYTGVLAIFASRLLNDKPPIIYEDGLQRRDFVSVHDVVDACMAALESPRAPGHALNIGSGRDVTIRDVAHFLADALGKHHIAPQISHKYRAGDIRHCFADITRARDLLGYEPAIEVRAGIAHLAAWLRSQQAIDRVELARRELTSRGLTP
jgi:dTDP-L-rhamnose 4-epimerase